MAVFYLQEISCLFGELTSVFQCCVWKWRPVTCPVCAAYSGCVVTYWTLYLLLPEWCYNALRRKRRASCFKDILLNWVPVSCGDFWYQERGIGSPNREPEPAGSVALNMHVWSPGLVVLAVIYCNEWALRSVGSLKLWIRTFADLVAVKSFTDYAKNPSCWTLWFKRNLWKIGFMTDLSTEKLTPIHLITDCLGFKRVKTISPTRKLLNLYLGDSWGLWNLSWI